MIILNTTFYVHESIDRIFRQWVHEQYLSSSLNSGLVNSSVARLMLEPQEGMSGYAVQVMADSLDKAMSWHDNEAAALRGVLSNGHGEKFLFFTTYMEQINQ